MKEKLYVWSQPERTRSIMAHRNHNYTREIAIVCLTVIAVVCVIHGINKALISVVSAIIGSIAGYEFKKKRKL